VTQEVTQPLRTYAGANMSMQLHAALSKWAFAVCKFNAADALPFFCMLPCAAAHMACTAHLAALARQAVAQAPDGALRPRHSVCRQHRQVLAPPGQQLAAGPAAGSRPKACGPAAVACGVRKEGMIASRAPQNLAASAWQCCAGCVAQHCTVGMHEMTYHWPSTCNALLLLNTRMTHMRWRQQLAEGPWRGVLQSIAHHMAGGCLRAPRRESPPRRQPPPAAPCAAGSPAPVSQHHHSAILALKTVKHQH
jgi:hypothetical protein